MVRTVLDRLYLFSGYLAGAFIVAIFLLMLALSAGRPLGINVPAGDDFVSWCMAATAFLGLAHTFKSGEMIRVGLITDRMPPNIRHVAEIIALTIGSVLIGFFGWYGVSMTYDSWRFNDIAQGVVALPLWIPQLGYAAGIVILFIAFIDEWIHVVRGNPPRYEKPKPETAEDILKQAESSAI